MPHTTSKPRRQWLAGLLLPVLGLCGSLQAQTPIETPAEAVAAPAPAAPPATASPPEATDPKPYGKVITSDAQTQKGLFDVHRVRSRLYFEIPPALLGKPLLMVVNAAAVPPGVDHAGKSLAQEAVRFVLRDNRVYLQAMNHTYVTGDGSANVDAVQAAQRDAILMALNVEAYGRDGAPVIEVSKLFTTEVGDFTARQILKARSLESARSYVNGVRAFPGSLRVDAVHTYMAPAMLNTPMGPKPAPASFPARANSIDMAYSIVELPAQPMMPRLADDRVGYFYQDMLNFGGSARPAETERYISRWRLEKKDPNAALSEPVKPIVWYIDRSTPTALVPYVKKGIEAWNMAFEAAGFKNAVQARPFPTREEDPEFDPEDVRYSVLRWVPSNVANAYGPRLTDPRTGEILNANIVMYHNIQQMVSEWYIPQAAPLDPRAQRLPLPDDLMGELVAYIVTHEVGHSLGFLHNMKASSTYPVDKLRDAKWLKTMGHTPSIMDYARFNYLVQPEDGIDPSLLIPRIGPYDVFATKWGYAPVPGARTPQQEKPVLDAWAREQDIKPWLRFSTPNRGSNDRGNLEEAVGDADAVTATGLGIRNLKRLLKLLPKMAIRPGSNDDDLQRLYKVAGTQWTTELRHVVAVVGSYELRTRHGDQPGAVAQMTPRAEQGRAVAFLNQQLFQTPQWWFEPAITERLAPDAASSLIADSQKKILAELLAESRLRSLLVQELNAGVSAYSVQQLLADLRAGILGELAGNEMPTPLRRNLQRLYVDLLAGRARNLEGGDDATAMLRAELRALRTQFASKRQSVNLQARAHWSMLFDMADRVFRPGGETAATAGATPSAATTSSELSDAGW
ncbi:zinc-dependent metalloprotease [Thermomonas sp.]|uniref:zinc-dependent metalloprotease n=1 Tax=Thermomonas sp. TaxID=1971895 RepID=UPI0039E6A79C